MNRRGSEMTGTIHKQLHDPKMAIGVCLSKAEFIAHITALIIQDNITGVAVALFTKTAAFSYQYGCDNGELNQASTMFAVFEHLEKEDLQRTKSLRR